jgi:phosphoribosylanthranilate isomerase
MRIKVCGITKPDQGEAIAQMGATALGFICVPASPLRYGSANPRRGRTTTKDIDRIGVLSIVVGRKFLR